MFVLSSNGPYACINCGYDRNRNVYKIYGRSSSTTNLVNGSQLPPSVTHLKLTDCPECEKPVDEYIQLDNCILFLDAILQKTRFYRHILINCSYSLRIPLKLSIIFGLCDAYRKWSTLHQVQLHDHEQKSYIELEFSFYLIFARTMAENLFLYLFLSLLFKALGPETSLVNMVSSLVICSYGKLFSVPAVLWAAELRPVPDILLQTSLFISLAQCLRVKSSNNLSPFRAFALVVATHLFHSFLLYLLYHHLLKTPEFFMP
jgi:hypothetical protein